jgi:hypothetical protein
MQKQLVLADQQSQQAQDAVRNNAMRLEEVTAKRMEMLGQLQAAKMQESVNKTMATITAKVGGDAPSLEEIEDKIQDRMAAAAAHAQIDAQSPEGAMAELERSVDLSSADATLDDLRAELGLGDSGAPAAPAAPAAPSAQPLPSGQPSTPPTPPTPPAPPAPAPSPSASPTMPANGSTDTSANAAG